MAAGFLASEGAGRDERAGQGQVLQLKLVPIIIDVHGAPLGELLAAGGELLLGLAEPVQEICLVLLVVDRAVELRSAIRADDPSGVVAGGDRVAVVEMAGPAEQRPELQADVVLSDVDLPAALSYYSGIRERQTA